MLNVANTRQFGNNAYIAPHASKSDGLLEIALVKSFLSLILAFLPTECLQKIGSQSVHSLFVSSRN